MENLNGFDFQELQFDTHGTPQGGVEELAAHVKDAAVTDVIFICHGFRNDETDARRLYGNFLTTFAQNAKQDSLAGRLGSRKFAVGGVFWPSMILPEPHDDEGSAQAFSTVDANQQRLEDMKTGMDAATQDKIDGMIALLPTADDDANSQLKMSGLLLTIVQGLPVEVGNECRAAFANATPETLRNALTVDAVDVVAAGAGAGGAGGIPSLDNPTTDGGGAQSFLGTALGFVPKFLNLTTFLLMFHRCGDVGANGISKAVRRVKELSNSVRVHLVGHSLGGRAVTACAKQLVADPPVPVDSMMLLEAAYSHFGLSQGGTTSGGLVHPRGFFRDVVEKKAVKGPILATHSARDSVVGFAYTSMAAVSLNNARAFGDENSPFGGIGRNGVLDTAEAVGGDLHVPGDAYSFLSGKIHNLDGSRQVDGKSLIDSHGDVTNPAVTWAFASLVAGT